MILGLTTKLNGLRRTQMKIRVKHNGAFAYVIQKVKNKPPIVTPFEKNAHNYTSLATCQNVRDDVLEYFSPASIVS